MAENKGNLAFLPRGKNAEAVLTKAFFNAGELLSMSGKDLSDIIGVSAATFSRMKGDKKRLIEKGTKQWELAALFVRIFRSLDAIVGGDEDKAKAWLRAKNKHLGEKPFVLLKSIEGITDVARYLDAMRGRV